MPRLRKVFIHNTVIDVCFRTETGLPIVATAYMKTVVLGIMAKAQSLYPVGICHYLVMANHFHMLLKVYDPSVVDHFIAYIKRETAHAINNFLGETRRTVWCDGYDSAVVLDASKAIDRIVHIYTNPQEANLEDTIEAYPNLSSWEDFLSGGSETAFGRIPRESIEPLPRKNLTLREQDSLSKYLSASAIEENVLYVSPDAWMDCFPETAVATPTVLNKWIVDAVRKRESELRRSRACPVIGSYALRLASPRDSHKPKKHLKRSLCLASSKFARIAFIDWYKSLRETSQQLASTYHPAKWLARLPPGLFAPGGGLRASILPQHVPSAWNGFGLPN